MHLTAPFPHLTNTVQAIDQNEAQGAGRGRGREPRSLSEGGWLNALCCVSVVLLHRLLLLQLQSGPHTHIHIPLQVANKNNQPIDTFSTPLQRP